MPLTYGGLIVEAGQLKPLNQAVLAIRNKYG
jgi:hypothetical protein